MGCVSTDDGFGCVSTGVDVGDNGNIGSEGDVWSDYDVEDVVDVEI